LIPRTTNNTQNRCRYRPIGVAVIPVIVYTTVSTRTYITSIVASRVTGGAVVLTKSTPIVRDARRLNTKLLLSISIGGV